jgi:hypothetical protein
MQATNPMQATKSKTELTLARYPGPVAFKPSRMKWLLVSLGSAVFTAGGIGMVATEADKGWFVLIFFAFCLAVSAIMLLPGAGGLVLDADGFQATSLFCHYRLRWQDVTGFEPISLPYVRRRMVGYNISSIGPTIGTLTTVISGRNASLPDTYGFSADELAELMQRWRDRAVAA